MIIALDVARSLRALGVEVVGPAHDFEDGMRLASEEPDLDGAVLDIDLRGVAVFPIADVLRSRRVPYVFATGYGSAAIPAAHRHAGHFEKPVLLDDVIQAVILSHGVPKEIET